MAEIMNVASKYNLFVIEDNAQAIGCTYSGLDHPQKTGTIGNVGCTSFFPSKNLGCYGDGGAMMTNDNELAKQLRMIANHGQSKKYYHDRIGCNSRLDNIQAAILRIKLRQLDTYIHNRQKAAAFYDKHFESVPKLKIPVRITKADQSPAPLQTILCDFSNDSWLIILYTKYKIYILSTGGKSG